MKDIKIKCKLFILAVAIVFCTLSYRTTVKAIQINSKAKIDIGEEITVTVDFGTYVAAYDRLEVTYNNRIMKYNSKHSLIENLWWDNTQASKGINKKVYSFIGTGNGISTIGVKAQGLVSANQNMDVLGDVQTSKLILVGNGITKGDMDGNGVITANDAAIILDIYKNGNATKDDILTGDMDGNGTLTANDAAMILDMYKNGK